MAIIIPDQAKIGQSSGFIFQIPKKTISLYSFKLKVMIARRLLFIVVILIIPQLLFSQVDSKDNLIALNSHSYSSLKLQNTSDCINFNLKYNKNPF